MLCSSKVGGLYSLLGKLHTKILLDVVFLNFNIKKNVVLAGAMMNGTALHSLARQERNEYRTMGTRGRVFKNKNMTRLRVYFLGGDGRLLGDKVRIRDIRGWLRTL